MRPPGPGEVDEEAVEGPDLDLLFRGKNILNHSYPLFSREEGSFFGIFKDGDDDPGENPENTLDDVHVPVRDRVEGPGVYGPRFKHLDSQLVPQRDLLSKYQKKRGLSKKNLGGTGAGEAWRQTGIVPSFWGERQPKKNKGAGGG